MKRKLSIMMLVLGIILGFSSLAFADTAGYDMSGEFDRQILQNPLDKDYQTEYKKAKTTLDYAKLEAKYTKLWDKELNNVYQKLLAKVSRPEKKILTEAQMGWLQWHTKENQFVSSMLANQQGTIWPIVQAKAYKNRIRERTLELMEYYYFFTNKIEFNYKNWSGLQ